MKMLLRAVPVMCLLALGLCIGCGGSSRDENPNPDLPYSTEGPPKREMPNKPGAPRKAPTPDK